MVEQVKAVESSSSKAPEPKKEPIVKRFGLDGDKVLFKMASRLVTVCLHDGTKLQGSLVGYSEYCLSLLVSGNVKLINKAFVVWIELLKEGTEK